jgi:hypothetical protein
MYQKYLQTKTTNHGIKRRKIARISRQNGN